MPGNSAWQNRIVGSGVKPASDFLAHELNWKIHPRFQQEAIEGSLDQVGWVKSVVESARTGKLLDGHARIILALRHGDDMPVPYEVVDVSEQEEALILATLDPLAVLAVAEKEKLDGLLRELPPVDARLQEMLAGLWEKNKPSASPTYSTSEYNSGNIEKTKVELENKFNKNPDQIEVICPECGETFYLNRRDT